MVPPLIQPHRHSANKGFNSGRWLNNKTIKALNFNWKKIPGNWMPWIFFWCFYHPKPGLQRWSTFWAKNNEKKVKKINFSFKRTHFWWSWLRREALCRGSILGRQEPWWSWCSHWYPWSQAHLTGCLGQSISWCDRFLLVCPKFAMACS